YLREAEEQPVVITHYGKPAGVLIGCESEDDWFDYRLENDSRFPVRVEKARGKLTRRARRPAGGPVASREAGTEQKRTSRRWRRAPSAVRQALGYAEASFI